MTEHEKLRNTWHKMMRRCINPKDPSFKWYGGRGISVCPEWQTFEQFAKDMGPSPTQNHSLDRIDSNKGYCPENCRWATQLEQQNNRTNNQIITFNGETHTLSEWSRKTGILVSRLYERVRRGNPPEKVLAKEDTRNIIYIAHEGKTMSIPEWARLLGMNRTTVYSRYRRGLAPEEIFQK